jgi:hypothetical protein
MVLSPLVLAILQMVGGIEENPGPAVEVENTYILGATGI